MGGETESETSLDKIEPTINSDTQSGVINKVKAAPTIEQAHASLNLGMYFNTTPEIEIGTPASQQSPMSLFWKYVQYDVVEEDEVGNVDDQHQDVFLNGECRRFLTQDLTPEVYSDISTVRSGLPPIHAAFFRRGVETPSESPQPPTFPETGEIVSPTKL